MVRLPALVMVKVSPATAPAGKPIFTVKFIGFGEPSSVLSIMPSLLASFKMVTVGAVGATVSSVTGTVIGALTLPAGSVSFTIRLFRPSTR